MRYQKGEVYYQLTYPEIRMLYPNIQSFVFVGKNLSPEDENDIWYFQFSDSYARYGSILDSDRGDRKVIGLAKDELEQMLDLEGLTSKLRAAAVRRKQAK